MNKSLNKIELRRLTSAPEVRVEREEREDGTTATYVSGYAVVFEQYSKPFWDEWCEIVSRGAFANTDMSDVVMVVDHSREVGDVLARSKDGQGTLAITIDEQGVKFRFAVPDTTKGRDVLALIERGDISECSFAFWVRRDSWLYDVDFEGKQMDVRRIEEVAKLADLSIVVEYGVRVPDVCAKIQESVISTVEVMTGLTVKAVNVSVEGIKFKELAAEKKAD